MKSSAPLKVSLHGMDERVAQMFTMYLAGPGRDCCQVVPEGQEDAVIVDLDGVGSQRLWFDVRRRFSGPALVLSVREHQLRNSLWVPKPLQAEAFIAAVEQLKTNFPFLKDQPRSAHQEASTGAFEARSFLPLYKSVEASGRTTGHAAEKIQHERRMRDCCGRLEDEVYRDTKRLHEIFFDPSDTVLSVMREALQLARQIRMPVSVDGLGHVFILDPQQRRLFTEMRESLLRPMCSRPRTLVKMRVRPVVLDDIPLPLLASADRRLRRLDTVIWNVALWTSQGRVPMGTNLDAPVHLRAWPNFTRLTLTPGAMQIAALWAQQPKGLRATAEHLKLPYRVVFSFFTACDALGLTEQMSMAEASFISGAYPTEVSSERRGLIRLMLNKLGLG